MSTTPLIRSVDVLIVGAGLSGVGMAATLTTEHPELTYAVLERRQAIGGTWDLFRYPGIRSDSDMLTFGYGFRPWLGTKILSDGAGIKQYVEETAQEYGVTDHIVFGRKVVRSSWSTAEDRWTVTALDEADGSTETWSAKHLVAATGYYSYDEGHRPTWPGEERFGGTLVHPQFWPEDLDYAGKKVVVIGSGATAISIVPEVARTAAQVTMLQRSPSYIATVPADDPVASVLAMARLPEMFSYKTGRARNIALQQGIYKFCRRAPKLARRMLLGAVRAQVGPEVSLEHFTPSYDPWDERLCVVPNGDLFRTFRRGDASIVTGHIKTFTEDGIELESGERIEADIVVTATGLKMQLLGGSTLEVDGEDVTLRERMLYKGVLVEGVPNAAVVIGYTNASWTLKADLAATYFSRLLDHMATRGYTSFVPRADDADRDDVSVLGASMRSGYVQRGDAVMPRQGKRGPWVIRNDFFRDLPMLKRARIDTPELHFDTRHPVAAKRRDEAVAG
jgi:cation diffusion facilitator CzcD-associated flavoprotein CzcO